MSDYVNFLSNIERRNDDLRLAEQSRQGEYIPTDSILPDRILKMLSAVRKSMNARRSANANHAKPASRKPFHFFSS